MLPKLWLDVAVVLICFLLGMALSYAIFVPKKNAEITKLVEAQKQREQDDKAEFDKKEKEYVATAKQTKDWYLSVIARIKSDRMLLQPSPDNPTKPPAGNPEGTDGTGGQLGLDSFLDGKSLDERIFGCKKDAAKLTALQAILFKANVPTQQ